MKRILMTILLFGFVLTPFFIRAENKIKILLVPGHDSEIWGAQYGGVKEANMNLAVASRLFKLLKKDGRFEVYITRDEAGYVKEFSDYFTNQESEIISFKEWAKKEIEKRIINGTFLDKETVPHNVVKPRVSVVLYGINKWANEKQMDAVIHIHFNDYPRSSKWTIGKYRGFSVYLPDGQMANAFESGQLAANIFTELDKKYSTSNYEKELGGLIPDQKLIALGASGTLEKGVRSVLVEYGYVYEKIFRNYTTRHKAYADMAKLTAVGIENYFFEE